MTRWVATHNRDVCVMSALPRVSTARSCVTSFPDGAQTWHSSWVRMRSGPIRAASPHRLGTENRHCAGAPTPLDRSRAGSSFPREARCARQPAFCARRKDSRTRALRREAARADQAHRASPSRTAETRRCAGALSGRRWQVRRPRVAKAWYQSCQ